MNDIIKALLETFGGQAKDQIIGRSTQHIQNKGDRAGDWIVNSIDKFVDKHSSKKK